MLLLALLSTACVLYTGFRSLLSNVGDATTPKAISSSNLKQFRSPIQSSPPACTEAELNKVSQRYPKKVLMQTNCPNSAAWLDKYLQQTFFPVEYPVLGNRPLVGVTLGCNKGDDAVDALRKLSRDASFDTSAFRETLRHHAKSHLQGRACPELPPSFLDEAIMSDIVYPSSLHSDDHNANDVVLHCVEAMPSTASALQQTAATFAHFEDSFIVTHAAIVANAQHDTVYFPAADTGVEYLGLDRCEGSQAAHDPRCEVVPAYTVDAFVQRVVVPQNSKFESAIQADQHAYTALLEKQQKQEAARALNNDINATFPIIYQLWASYRPNFVIDLLFVDIEGYDWQALGQGGADWTLRHTRYLEFEYHGQGAWKRDLLSTAVQTLDDTFGFTCYWSGRGELIRLSKCFQPYMEFHMWSNVACVNRELNPHLAAQMEMLYTESLGIGSVYTESLGIGSVPEAKTTRPLLIFPLLKELNAGWNNMQVRNRIDGVLLTSVFVLHTCIFASLRLLSSSISSHLHVFKT